MLTSKPHPELQLIPCVPEHRAAVRQVLQAVGWAEQYISANEQNVVRFSQEPGRLAGYLALLDTLPVGFIFVEIHQWNCLSQIQGLAVHPAHYRKGIASALVDMAEAFAREKNARGIYLDTPVDNVGGRAFYEAAGYQLAYLMPRYYEDALDGVTYQKFWAAHTDAISI